jgi:hypothetical protein
MFCTRFLVSSWHSCIETGYISCSPLITAVKEWRLEQLLAAGDSRVFSRTDGMFCTRVPLLLVAQLHREEVISAVLS